MATVTGFTAERMLEIENTTVVDGEIQGNNLILLQRDGTPIDAGNVRGPQGPPGPSGTIGSVNDQAQSAVYAPRIFATKAALDSGWAAAPNGAVAVTLDNESIWEKRAAGWFITNSYRVFSGVSEATTRWPDAPRGSHAVSSGDDMGLYKSNLGWNFENGIRLFQDATERDARWPAPPQGAMCVLANTNELLIRLGGLWRPPIGSIIYGQTGWVSDTNFNGPGWRDIAETTRNLTYPYRTTTYLVGSFSGGYGADWTGYTVAAWGFSVGGQVSAFDSAANAAMWSSGALCYTWSNPPNTEVGFKVSFNPFQFGGGGYNCHIKGNWTLQVIAMI